MNDTSMYHEPGAERSFEELRALLDRTLRSLSILPPVSRRTG